MEDQKSANVNASNATAQFYEPTLFGDYGKYMHNKRGKLQVQHNELRNSVQALGMSYPQIFKDMAIYLNGHAGPVSISQLSQLVTLHGGTWLPYLDRKSSVTHILATNLTHKKMEEFKSYKVVLPTWIVHCVEEGRVLDWRDYRLSSHTMPLHQDTPDTSVFGEEDGANPGGSLSMQKNLLGIFKSTRPYGSSKTTETETTRPYEHGTDPANPKHASAAHSSSYYPSKSNARANDLVADPAWRLQHTAANPDFVTNYFKSSRLHYLATSKSKLPFMVSRLKNELNLDTKRSAKTSTTSKKPSLSGTAADRRVIWHVDIDCFFVSAGLVSHPELRGKPIAVCHSGEHQDVDLSTSEVASCSYEARSYGIKNGMSLYKAKKLCPHIMTIPYDFIAYETVSEAFYRTLLQYADELQPVSVDEVYMDVSSRVIGANSDIVDESASMELAHKVRKEIKDLTGCEVSVGSGCNMLLARLATRKAKPASAFHVSPDNIKKFLDPHSVDDLPGIGYSIRERLQDHFEVSTVEHLRGISKTSLQDIFGPQQGEMLSNYALGVDPRPLVSNPPARKSVSAEINYAIRLESQDEVERFLMQLSREVSKRLKDCGVRGSHLTLNIMTRHPDMQSEPPKFLGHGPCSTHSKTHNMGVATDDADMIKTVSWKLLEGCNFDPRDLRGVGIQMQKLKAVGNNSHAGDGDSADLEPSQPQLNFLKANEQKDEDHQQNSNNIKNKKIPLFQDEEPEKEDEDKKVKKVLGKRRVSESSEDDIIILEDIKKREDSPDIISICDLPTMSQMDVSVYKALPYDLQKEAMDAIKVRSNQKQQVQSEKRTSKTEMTMAVVDDTFASTKPGITRQTRISKRGKLIVPAQRKIKISNFTRDTSSLRPPSPRQIEDTQLCKLGIVDTELFRSLPRALQIEALNHSWQTRGEQTQQEIVAPQQTRKELGKKQGVDEDMIIDNEDGEQPSIFGKFDSEDVQDVLEIWVGQKWEEGPHESDLEHLFKGLCGMICVKKGKKDKRKIQDLESVCKIMLWWRMLIRDRKKMNVDNVDEWETAFENTMKRINEVVKNENGGVLALR